MGTRKKNETTTDYSGAFKSYDRTPEEEALANYTPDRTLLDAGTKASYGAARRGIEEGVGGYSGITNPYAAARAKEIGLQELADQESSAMADANVDLNRLGLQNKQFLAGLRRPQYIQTGQKTTVDQGGGLLSSLISGGLGLASAFV